VVLGVGGSSPLAHPIESAGHPVAGIPATHGDDGERGGAPDMTGQPKFRYGDHLMVHRPGFTHHGVYVSDERVIDFGAYDSRTKRHNGVRPVTLEQFAGGRRVEVVQHPSPGRMFGPRWLPNPLPPDQIVAEAERLAEIAFIGKYTLFGSNCEHVANWCVTGNYFESLQIKKFFRAHAIALLIMLLLHRWKGPNTVWRVTYWALLLLGAVAQYQWRRAPQKFWEGVEIKPGSP
jgi:HRAS-like suppressor 3